MSNLVEQVACAIRNRRLLRQHEPILVAVSGGVDSMVLLRVLHELSAINGWPLTVGHLNHQIRGRSSDADERLVKRTAEELGLKSVIERLDVPSLAQGQGLSLEVAARKARHEFFARVATRLEIASIAVAHHADDQLELFFLRLLRGSGGEGLAGMKWRNPSPVRPEIQLVRPLLDLSKAALRQYAAEFGVKFREDASNACMDIQRNRIRHRLLPFLRKEFQPALDTTLRRTVDVIGAEAEFVALTARKWLAQKVRDSFKALPPAVQRRCVQLQLLELGVIPNFDLIEQLRLAEGRPVSVRITTSDSVQALDNLGSSAVREADGTVRLQSERAKGFSFASFEVDLLKTGRNTRFDGLEVVWRVVPKRGLKDLNKVAGREYFDADKVGRRISLRHWRPGDRFQPSGMTSAMKLQDLFVNHKVPRELRHQAVVAVCCGEQLFWVEGFRISERFKLHKNTIRRLHWQWRRL